MVARRTADCPRRAESHGGPARNGPRAQACRNQLPFSIFFCPAPTIFLARALVRLRLAGSDVGELSRPLSAILRVTAGRGSKRAGRKPLCLLAPSAPRAAPRHSPTPRTPCRPGNRPRSGRPGWRRHPGRGGDTRPISRTSTPTPWACERETGWPACFPASPDAE